MSMSTNFTIMIPAKMSTSGGACVILIWITIKNRATLRKFATTGHLRRSDSYNVFQVISEKYEEKEKEENSS